MRYSEILELYECFQPNYDITNEQQDYWKRFIPTERFCDVLRTTINSLEQSSEKKSIWIQGTYGTGKSHATAVIKHLLWDDLESTDDFIEGLSDLQIKEHLRNFRKMNRIFPVLLKGASNIADNRSFALVLERAVKEALRSSKTEILTDSDFEKVIFHLESDQSVIDWNKIIEDNQKLRTYASTKEDLLKKLKEGDIAILKMLEDSFAEKRIDLCSSRLDKWLADVSGELRRKNIADSMMIYWDEFTSVLESSKAREIMVELQNIAELSANNNVFLFVVSHRDPSQVLPQDDIERLRDRFHSKRYDMEPLTTYHIISNAIRKKDEDKWNELKKIHLETNDNLNMLVSRLVENEGVSAVMTVENLFPIHPYTAYLATFVARNIGSTERSIFGFLYDRNKGFLRFINEHPHGDLDCFLTVDYLWDFFLEEFELDSSDRFGSVLDRYKIYIPKMESKGEHYTSIFKGVMLLNILSRFIAAVEVGKELIAPSLDNIVCMFHGTQFEQYVQEVLSYIDESGCIPRTPDDLFLISSASFTTKELEIEKNKQARIYEDITKILRLGEKEFIDFIVPGVLREMEIKLYPSGIGKNILLSRLQNDFKKASSVHIALFLMKERNEQSTIDSVINELFTEEGFEDIIFAVIGEPLKTENFKRFIEYSARSALASIHNFKEEKITSDRYTQSILKNWISRIRDGFIELGFRGAKGTYPLSRLSDKINEDFSPEIFKYGLEKLARLQKNINVWKPVNSKISAEIFLFADSRSYIEIKTSKGLYSYLRWVLKDNKEEYIVDENLEIKKGADLSHPLVRTSNEVISRIEKLENRTGFNLGTELEFLTRPPFGIYANMANMALMGLVMRSIVGRLYEIGTGKPIEKELMRDKILSLFNCWEKGKDRSKLEVRLGTTEEKELVGKLKDIFALDDMATSLTNTRWKIREWVKDSRYPLWSFKTYFRNSGRDAIEQIFEITKRIDREIAQADILDTLNVIENNEVDLRHYLRKNMAEEGFANWLEEIENVVITDKVTVDEIVQFLREHMQEQIASWEEAEVKTKILTWLLEKAQKTSVPSREKPLDSVDRSEQKWKAEEKGGDGKYIPAEPSGGHEEEREKLDRIRQKILQYEGNLRSLVIRIIEENSEILELMYSYFEKEEKHGRDI